MVVGKLEYEVVLNSKNMQHFTKCLINTSYQYKMEQGDLLFLLDQLGKLTQIVEVKEKEQK